MLLSRQSSYDPARSSMRAFTILFATASLLSLAACAGGDDDERSGPEGRPAPRLVRTIAVEGGSDAERDLLRRVVEGMAGATLTRVTISPPEARRQLDGESVIGLSFATVPGVTARRQWDEWIVAGAFSRRLLEADLAATVDGSDPRGAFTAQPRVEGNADPEPLPKERESAVLHSVREAAAESGATLAGLEVHRPYGLAVALSLTPPDPAVYLRDGLRPLLATLDRHRPELEGVYVAVLDGSNRLVLEWGSWTRNPAGTYWVRRDLADCSPIRQSDPPGTEPPPPCPAS
jgi:hypothetical protein